jgi:hypothetical protein
MDTPCSARDIFIVLLCTKVCADLLMCDDRFFRIRSGDILIYILCFIGILWK